MADYEAQDGLDKARLAAVAMTVGAGLLALLAALWALAELWALSSRPAAVTEGAPPGNFLTVSDVLLRLFSAWTLSLLLWGAAELLRRLSDLLEAVNTGFGVFAGRTGSPLARVRAGDEHQTQLLDELVHLTRELRDIELLSPEERAKRLEAEAGELVRQLEQEVPALLREHNLQQAQLRVRRARQRFPSLKNWDALEQQVEQARTKLEAHDIAAATREVDDLAALGAWDRAAEVVRHLRQRHPNSDAVVELNRRITLGRERASAEERAKLMSQAQAATNRKQWNEALRLVETLLDKYPGSPESQELRAQVAVLKDNVEIQHRQEMETRIRELIRDHRLAEALRVANELITRYPDSPQAHVLRQQILPKLEQRAAEGM
jgi:outer membrane protein assembly factor BamD (BamD/ComL family)